MLKTLTHKSATITHIQYINSTARFTVLRKNNALCNWEANKLRMIAVEYSLRFLYKHQKVHKDIE